MPILALFIHFIAFEFFIELTSLHYIDDKKVLPVAPSLESISIVANKYLFLKSNAIPALQRSLSLPHDPIVVQKVQDFF